MLEVDLFAQGGESQFAQGLGVVAGAQVLDDAPDALERHLPLRTQCAHNEQGKQVLVAVQPDGVPWAEPPLDRGHDKLVLFPVSESTHGDPGEPGRAGVREREEIFGDYPHRLHLPSSALIVDIDFPRSR